MEVLHDMLDQIERQRLSKMVSEMPDDDTVVDNRFIYVSVLLLLTVNFERDDSTMCRFCDMGFRKL